MAFAEDNYENAVIQLFEQLGYGYVYGPNVVRDYTEVLYLDELEPALLRINPSLLSVAIDEAINKLRKFEIVHYFQKNEVFMNYLQNGIEVSYYYKDEQQNRIRNLLITKISTRTALPLSINGRL